MRAEKSVGLLVVMPTPEAVAQAINDGFTLVCLGIDTVFLDQGARATRALALSALEKMENARDR
jgi:2-keto-3-deoxy-L-rhamnonate aldolase RhmA